VIATTTIPGEMDIGLAWKYPVDRILYLDGATINVVKLGNDGSLFTGTAHPLANNKLTLCADETTMPQVNWGEPGSANGWFDWLNKRKDRSKAGNRVVAVDTPPNGPHFGRTSTPAALAQGLP